MKDLCITPFQHEMRAAPAWAGASCGHRAKCFGLAVELRKGLYDIMAQWTLEFFSLPSGHAL